MKFKKIKKKDLDCFFHSDFYKNLTHVPLTLNRLTSYVHNPYSNENDYVLYLLIENEQIISYRTLLHDKNSKDEIFVWSSGSWTNPSFRKKGYSKQLFLEVRKDYSDKIIIYTRSISSKILYQSFKDLYFIEDHHSKELHYDFSILNKKFPKIISSILNKFIRIKSNKEYKNQFKISKLNIDTSIFLDEQISNDLFPLTIEKIKWIKNYPWLHQKSEAKNSNQIFDFSFIDSSFKSDAFEMTNKNEQVTAFYYRNIRQNIFYLHYVYYQSNKEALMIAEAILEEFNGEKLSIIVIRDKVIQDYIRKLQKPLFIKSYKNFLYISEDKKYHLTKNIQHGIGELIFT
ncbi:hypothetical protein NZD85_11120 [Empedobacter stercoris]|uniref:hypothetical protein n=1 Tax=Empedobacter stercoris TaxID=1628248 RepID=UPI0021AF38D9|nr:hypothetical protein [Empedobacter stercoris]UWX66426.1 hypothetical protein NZD85_11120 [Empedobacter stercoris]